MSEYKRYIVGLKYKIPYKERDISHSLSRIEESWNGLKDRPIGEPVVWSVDATDEELDRIRRASNLDYVEPVLQRDLRARFTPHVEEFAFARMENAYSLGYTGSGVTVGVIDSQLDDAFRANFNIKAEKYLSTPPAGNYHGAQVSSVAVPVDARLAFYGGPVTSEQFIKGTYWMVDEVGVDVINISAGSYTFSQGESDAFKHAHRTKGVPIMIAAGNDNTSNKSYPGAYQDDLAISAVDRQGIKAWFANYGDWIWAWASGVQVEVQDAGGGAVRVDGTSFSSPLAAFMYACLRTKMKGQYAHEQIINEMYKTRRDGGILTWQKSAEETTGKDHGSGKNRGTRKPGLCRGR